VDFSVSAFSTSQQKFILSKNIADILFAPKSSKIDEIRAYFELKGVVHAAPAFPAWATPLTPRFLNFQCKKDICS
jgi:hypothetical protein